MSATNLPEKWTVKQFLFAKAYIGEAKQNATKAAIMAGYTENAASEAGYAILRKAQYLHVQEYIEEEIGAIVDKFDVSAEALVRRLAEIANCNIEDVVQITESGRIRLKPFDEIAEHAKGAIKSITDKSGNTDEIGVQLHDPIAAIKEIAKILKIYEDGAQVNFNDVQIVLPDNGRDDPYLQPGWGKEDD